MLFLKQNCVLSENFEFLAVKYVFLNGPISISKSETATEFTKIALIVFN